MARLSRINFVGVCDSLTVAILGVALAAGKIAGVVASPANSAVAAGLLLAAVLLLPANLRVLRGPRGWSGWFLLALVAAAFALVNFRCATGCGGR